jgi:exo-beta-1,3-glucanase (GH17 family)
VSGPQDRYSTGLAPALFALTALAVGIVWWRLGAPVALPPSPLAVGEKLYCVSYAPFRDRQDPLVEGTYVDPRQIDDDLALLSKYTDCVRTYSTDFGLDRIAEIAQRHGLKVVQGLWLSSNAEKNRQQIATAVALAKEFPDVIRAVVVGNEVLLRGEMSAPELIATLREVKAQVPEPVTYAEVWEYWLRFRDVQNAVDFVTIHILPYWEDYPLPAAVAARHVDEIRKRVAAAIPNKQIVIGEVGWPSAGRMREGALPSPSNQARVIVETLTLAKRENFQVNVIEAFDQPWKRWLEGTVGGHWGIFDRSSGGPKFSFAGAAVSDHPYWLIEALAGIVLAAATFGAAFAAARNKPAPRYLWPQVTALALPSAVLLGWTLEKVPMESFTAGGWLRSLAFAVIATAAPLVCAMACATRRPLPTFSALLGGAGSSQDAVTWALGGTFIALVLLSLQVALGLVFDPRYRDFPFTQESAAVISFLVLRFSTWRVPRAADTPRPSRAVAETVAAGVLAAAAVYIVLNESFANWQAVWFCASLLGLGFILGRARVAPS